MTELSPKAVDELRQMFREHTRRMMNEAPPRARWQKRGGSTSGNNSSTAGGGNCDCSFQDVGSQDCFGESNVMPNQFIADNLGEFGGADVIVTWDSSDDNGCTFISDETDVECS